MNTNILKLVTCLAWAGVAVASAAPADALAVTTQTGEYASCSNDYSVQLRTWCRDVETQNPGWQTTHIQTIKLVSTPCGAGGCAGQDAVYTDTVYGTGRKTVTWYSFCDADPYYIYGFGSCGC
jgi:hypothetical protein